MYQEMTSILSPAICGDYALEHFSIKQSHARAMMDGVLPGNYIRLSYNNRCIMSNTPMEWRTNLDFIRNATGDVLIGGLGLGMIVLAIQDNPEVSSITIIEKSSDVIQLITAQIAFNSKVKIVQGDVFTWVPERGQKFDCIYQDIWEGINRDIYKNEMSPLKRKYGHYLKSKSISPNRFNMCWAEWYAKNNYRL